MNAIETKPLYLLANNGECVCDEHLMYYGIRKGRDSSGRRVQKMTPADRAYMVKALGREIDCEMCRGLA